MKNMRIGIQMYTIREPLAADYKGTCRELVKLGCDGVELAWNYGGMEPEELAAFFREIGLAACGMHMRDNEWNDPDSRVFDYASALGVPYVTCSWGGDFSVVWQECAAMCTAAGLAARRHRLQFTYHNHAAEMVEIDGVPALDRIYAATDAQSVQAELDVYWLQKGGADPCTYIRRYARRLPQLHLKDMDPEDGSFTELGRGTVDLAGCVAAARDTSCEWLIYEQDRCKHPQFESAAVSLEYLKKLL